MSSSSTGWSRRGRAAIVIAATWSVFWGTVVLACFSAIMLRLAPYQRTRIEDGWTLAGSIPATAFIVGALLGLVAGLLFSGLLASIEHRRGGSAVPLHRFAIWGGVAGFGMWQIGASLISWPFSALLASVFALCGSATAVGTLLVVRRAPRLPTEMGRRKLPVT